MRIALLAVVALAFAGFGTGALAHEKEKVVEGTLAAEATVGGFDVRGIKIPMATVEREAARDYLDRVRPILVDSAREPSRVFEPEARLDDGEVTLSVGVETIESTREAAQKGLQRLREVEPPNGLKDVHRELVGAHEDAISAYADVIAAYVSRNVDRLNDAVGKGLPRMERLDDAAHAVLQDLGRAAPPEQGAVQEAQQGADRAEQELKRAEEEVRPPNLAKKCPAYGWSVIGGGGFAVAGSRWRFADLRYAYS